MEINGKVHCFFEQSGTFKNEFKKLGYEAFDYDIQDNFGETDYVIDLFAEIEKAYEGGGGESIFDNITKDDLIMAFFPCIEFSCVAQNSEASIIGTCSLLTIYFGRAFPNWRVCVRLLWKHHTLASKNPTRFSGGSMSTKQKEFVKRN